VFARLVGDAPDARTISKRIPLLTGKTMLQGKPTAYVCKNYTCQAPTTDVKTLIEQISR